MRTHTPARYASVTGFGTEMTHFVGKTKQLQTIIKISISVEVGGTVRISWISFAWVLFCGKLTTDL